MKVIKPNTLGLIHQTYYLKQHLFVVSALSFFKLGKEADLLADSEQWQRLQAYLAEGVVVDTGHVKGNAEVLLAGKAYAPNGEPVKKMKVNVEIGGLEKTLQVIGNRTCSAQGALLPQKVTEPEAFTSMPLTFSESYGGPDYEDNTLGKGVMPSSENGADKQGYPLANLYLDSESIKPDKRPREVACFLPRDITHSFRAQFQGTYDQDWLDHVHPGFPDDTDLRLFNCAPVDQQCAQMFEPGMSYSLLGLHPDHAELKGRLPNVYVRAFVSQEENDDVHFKEIATQIDTVWFFPDLELGIAIHRGTLAVKDSVGLDIKNLMLAMESVEDTPREKGYFQTVLEQRLDSKTAIGHSFNASQLLPQLNNEEVARRAKLYAQAEADQAKNLAKKRLKQLTKLRQQHPELDWRKVEQGNADAKDTSDAPGPIPKEFIDKGDFDLSPYIAWSQQQVQKAKEKLADAKLEMTTQLDSKVKKATPIESEVSIASRFNEVVLIQGSTTEEALDEEASPQEKQAKLQRMVSRSQRRARQFAPASTRSERVSKQGAQWLREKVLALLQRGESLAGRDLAGADLSGLVFSDLDLRDVMLEGADLTGCHFSHCQCDGLVLTQALMDHACIEHCCLKKANLSKLHCRQTRFVNTLFDHTVCMESHFEECRFSDSNFNKMSVIACHFQGSNFSRSACHGLQFVQSQLIKTRWDDAKLIQSTFLECDFYQSRWTGANLQKCAMLKSKMFEVDFTSVSAQRMQISLTGDCTQTVFTNSQWLYCGFRTLSFVDSDFSKGKFKHCDFSMTQFTKCHFKETLLDSCLLFKAQFNEDICRGSLFYQSDFSKTLFSKTDLSDVTFHQSSLQEVDFLECQLTGLKRYPLASLTGTE